ncbi:MAG: AAA family ATPase, partial [Hyphomicrobiaceae bacterium]
MTANPLWIERLTLDNFRNYRSAIVEAAPGPAVLFGPNGAGKTNVLEAVSLLVSGQGLRRAPLTEVARHGSSGGWAVAARLHTLEGPVTIGTGRQVAGPLPHTSVEPVEPVEPERPGRVVRIDGSPQPASALAAYVAIVWLTPAMDGLFAGAASDRRRFLDRLIAGFDAGYRLGLGHFERAMQQRNLLLADGVRDGIEFEGLETVMAETGVAIAAARAAVV